MGTVNNLEDVISSQSVRYGRALRAFSFSDARFWQAPTGSEILFYNMGDGEAACLALAKHTKDYIASSNLKDIREYCKHFGIVYLTTMDILLEAYQKGIMTEVQCNTFIQEVKSKDSKLIEGINTIKQYEQMVKK